MDLTKKQTILIAVVSGAILLLTVAAILLFPSGDGEAPAEPEPSPTQTLRPTMTPIPTATPAPTVFRLPLVPQSDTPRPTAEAAGTVSAFVPPPTAPPVTEPPDDGAGPYVAANDENTRDILAVGLQDGRAAALLLLRLAGDTLSITALPAKELQMDDEALSAVDDLYAQGARAATLARSVTGSPCAAWMALDLGCLPDLMAATGPLDDKGGLTGEGIGGAEEALSLGVGAVIYLEKVPLLKLPALKRAVGDSFASSLSPRELWGLFWTIRKGVTVVGTLSVSKKHP